MHPLAGDAAPNQQSHPVERRRPDPVPVDPRGPEGQQPAGERAPREPSHVLRRLAEEVGHVEHEEEHDERPECVPASPVTRLRRSEVDRDASSEHAGLDDEGRTHGMPQPEPYVRRAARFAPNAAEKCPMNMGPQCVDRVGRAPGWVAVSVASGWPYPAARAGHAVDLCLE